MKLFWVAMAFVLIGTNALSETREDDRYWDDYYRCTEIHLPNVARVVVSLHEGARLISHSLCQKEHTELVNQIFQKRVPKISFENAFGVIQRETIERIYYQKLR